MDANVICSATNMVVEIEQLHSVGLHKDYLRLNDPACTLDSNGTHVVANISLNACGTMIEVKLFSRIQKKQFNKKMKWLSSITHPYVLSNRILFPIFHETHKTELLFSKQWKQKKRYKSIIQYMIHMTSFVVFFGAFL